MPLVRIDLVKGIRSPDEIKKLANVVQEVMRKHFNAPERDRYQIITQHEPYELICEDTNLGMERSNKLVIIQILQQGRSAEQKLATYRALQERLFESCGLPGEDLIISCAENSKADWSFGEGEAQFLTGTL
ncbi:Tautomerase/MIF superfamily [Aspergillus minisclerotigenes]|uniref:Tautomerase/MIF superfamily n=1 Tax=Aspergillus minisclerotigenes TaxID=656917 RepID=A0A5N6IPG4_9EURO|nr:Tautomerase/MIF superfamily [Aspergillus minisclerotigenes]